MNPRIRWRMIPHFLIRRAGFPFHLLDQLGCPESYARSQELAGQDEAAEAARLSLLRQHFPGEVKRLAVAGDRRALKTLSAWRRVVGQRQPKMPPEGPWSAALQEAHLAWLGLERVYREAERVFLERFEAEREAAGAALFQLAATPRVREALFLLVPAVSELAGRPRPGDRALERRLYAFIQRLTSKNETTSFFGPLTHAVVAGERTLFGPEAPGGVTLTEVFPSFWAVVALAQACAQDPEVRPDLPVRRISASRVEGERAFGPSGEECPLGREARALYQVIDDRRPLVELAGRAGLSPEGAASSLRALEKGGFARRDLEPLSTTHYPLLDLMRRIPRTPSGDAWRERLTRFQAQLEAFGRADLDGRRSLLPQIEAQFEQITGKSARRGQGEMYADRSIFYEECAGDGQPARMGVGDAERLEADLTPVLQLGASFGRVRHQALRRLAGETLSDMNGGPVPFLAFAAALDARIAAGGLKPLDAQAAEFLEQLNQRVAQRSDGRVARLTTDLLAGLITQDVGWRFASPDVMLERVQGRLRAVIGEVHPYVFAWGSQNHFAPDPAALQAAFSRELRPWGGANRIAVVLRRRRHKGLVSEAFPGRFIEVTGRGSDDPARKVAVADLRVTAGEEGPVLEAPDGPVTLYVGEEDHPHLRAFAPPLVEMPKVRLGAHTPRVVIGEVVFQRERWELRPDDLREVTRAFSAAGLALAVGKAQRHHGWPRHLFLSAASEPKPICIDLASPLAHTFLQRLGAQGPLVLTEMLPSPQGLWCERSAGAHTSELRIGMVRGP